MSDEADFIAALRAIAVHPGARGLADDVAVLPPPVGRDLVMTHDMIAEGVHYLSDDPPGDVAWKLVAVNLSDLAAKGARPIGLLLGHVMTGDSSWDAAFVEGLGRALRHFDLPLLGGDTIALPPGSPRVLGLTAIGEAPRPVPDRRSARPGDTIWLCGVVGDAGLGLQIARGEIEGPRRLLKAYRLPMPRLSEGQAVARHVHAMMDVSDGLLIDAARLADASGVALHLDLDALPLSADAEAFGNDRAARLRAATAGDDYALLLTASADKTDVISAISPAFTLIGHVEDGSGLHLTDRDGTISLPSRLGYMHQH